MPIKAAEQPKITFKIQPSYTDDLKDLPWGSDLEDWEDDKIKFISFRKGISRHPVRFIKTSLTSYAIKQTTEHSAIREIKNYEDLLIRAIHTLIPIGYVKSERAPLEVATKIGTSFIEDSSAFVLTELEHKALPDSYLYRLNFKEENRKLIWDAVAELLAALHFNNIYWGDASLSNILVRFFKIRDQKGRVKTELKAVLADAETIELLPQISLKMREEELDFFFESMTWLNEDYRNAGYTRADFSTQKDKKYILKQYKNRYKLLRAIDKFQKEIGIDVRRYFKSVNDINAIHALHKQINEHKWYLSESSKTEVSIEEVSQKWLNDVYLPIIKEFELLDIFEYFPFKSSSELYVDIMTHKYFLSQAAGKDVGTELAINDYSEKYAISHTFLLSLKKAYKKFLKLFN